MRITALLFLGLKNHRGRSLRLILGLLFTTLLLSVHGCVIRRGVPINPPSPASRQRSSEDLRSLIFLADIEGIARLAAQDMDFNQPLPQGTLPLFEAIRQDKPAVIRALVKNGARLTQNNAQGQTALEYAIVENREHSTQILLALGANPNQRDRQGNPLLVVACAAPSVSSKIVGLLVQHGADLQLVGAFGRSPVQALTRGRTLDLTELPSLEAHKLVYLIDAGLRPPLPTDASGQPSLHQLVATLNHRELVTKLIQVEKLKVNARDRQGWTPLHVAMWQQQPGAAAALLGLGADPNAETTAPAEKRCAPMGGGRVNTQPSLCRYLVPTGSRPLDIKPERYYSGRWSETTQVIRQAGGTQNPHLKPEPEFQEL
jgi:ankyrin repeat protein